MNETKTKILVVFGGTMAYGGIEFVIMNYLRHFNHSSLQIDVLQFGEKSGIFDQEIQRYGGNVFFLHDNAKLYGSKSKQLRRILKNGKYSGVHFHTDDFAVKTIFLTRLDGVRNVIAHSHNNDDTESGKLGPLKRKLTTRWSKYHFACSEEAGKWLFGKKNFVVINNAIDPGLFSFSISERQSIRHQYSIPESAFVIGCVGHFLPRHKNQLFLLDIFQTFQKENPNSFLILVGDGEEKNKIINKIAQLSLKNVILLGSRSDVNRYYSAFDACCLPSFHEGLSISSVEAIANGLYCVNSTNVPYAKGLERYEIRIPLSEPVSVWSKSLKTACLSRERTRLKEIQEAGFDINIEAKKLQSFYESLRNKRKTNDAK